jgi:hypothetical protein
MPNKPANRPANRPGAAKPPRNNKPVNAWAFGPNMNIKPVVNRNNRMNTQRPKQQQKPANQANRKMGGNNRMANRP